MPNGKIVTNEQRLHQTVRSTAMAAGILAATVSLSASSYAQGKPVVGDKQAVSTNAKDKNRSLSQISFTVSDIAGSLIPKAEVALTSTDSNEYKAVTNDRGHAGFSGIPRGDYQVTISSPGFRPFKNTVRIQLSIEPTVNITLAVGTFVGTVVVVTEVPLFMAIAQSDNEAVERSVNEGFDINQKDSEGRTALHIAVEHGNLDIVRFLLDKKAKVNAKDNDMLTPIWMLTEVGDEETKLEILKLLMRHGGDINIRNEEKETLLMMASDDDNIEVVRILLNAGANPNLKDEDGETALDKTSFEEIKQLLISHGARPS
ncbi:MAG: ankyrin repeat domain-containing protein [Acidobacteriota bacterium]